MRKTFAHGVDKVADILVTFWVILFLIGYIILEGITSLIIVITSIKPYKELVNTHGEDEIDEYVLKDMKEKMEQEPKTVRECIRKIFMTLGNSNEEERKEMRKKVLGVYKKIAKV